MRQIILGFGRGDLILAALGMIWKPREVYSKHAATATEHQGRVTYPTTGIIRITYTDEQPGKNCFLDLFARGIRWLLWRQRDLATEGLRGARQTG